MYRPEAKASFAETLPQAYGRPGTSINPQVELLREAYDRAPMKRSWRDGGIVADRPTDGGFDERPRVAELPDLSGLVREAGDANRKAQLLLDLFIGSLGGQDQLMAGYVPFKGVAPADVDIGGPESPETMARAAAYIDQLRRSGQVDRARKNLIQRGIPLPGV